MDAGRASPAHVSSGTRTLAWDALAWRSSVEGSPLRFLTTKKPGTSRVSTSDEADIVVQPNRSTRTKGTCDSSFFPLGRSFDSHARDISYALTALDSRVERGFSAVTRHVSRGLWVMVLCVCFLHVFLAVGSLLCTVCSMKYAPVTSSQEWVSRAGRTPCVRVPMPIFQDALQYGTRSTTTLLFTYSISTIKIQMAQRPSSSLFVMDHQPGHTQRDELTRSTRISEIWQQYW